MMRVDLRSDTVTKPSAAMRRVMAEAEVGDVVFSDDPTVLRLEAVVAERFGMEAAMFVPSGTMSNQLGVGSQAGPGDAVLLPAFAHVARWEGGGIAATFGAQLVHIEGESGLPSIDAFEAHCYGAHPKAPRPALMVLENTHNWAGGRVYTADEVGSRVAWAKARGLATHLDGARIWNASVATGASVETLVAGFDTVSVCFSKGLGAPIGSCLVGRRDVIARADRLRHRLGGGWRQAGLLAAAALYAIEHNVARMADDHRRAAALAELLVKHDIGRPLHAVESNIVQFAVSPRFGTAAGGDTTAVGTAKALADSASARGVVFLPTGPATARVVTHLEVDDAQLAQVDKVFAEL